MRRLLCIDIHVYQGRSAKGSLPSNRTKAGQSRDKPNLCCLHLLEMLQKCFWCSMGLRIESRAYCL